MTKPEPRPAIRHVGPCGHRARCYRSDCLERFGPYKTVEILRNRIVFYCHSVVVPADAVDLRMLEVAP
jgi:hypothetical protein